MQPHNICSERARQVKPFFWPPTLILRQAASALYYGGLVGWRHMPAWFIRHGFKSLPVAAGSIGMGCIGFPSHPVWEVSAACNLRCIHCHASGGQPAPDELNTQEGKRLLDDLAQVDEFRIMVYTGGEPLMRPDIFDLMDHSHKLGFVNLLATNATLIDEATARRLRQVGVVGAAVGLDGPTAETHNRIRNAPDAFQRAMAGIQALKRAGILIQINVTAMAHNVDVIAELIEFSDDLHASLLLMYQLATIGRGREISTASLNQADNEQFLRLLAEKQRSTRAIIEPVVGPQYWPYLLERRGLTGDLWLRMAEMVFHGCVAGGGLAYIKPNGDVWPCPFVEVNCGNVRQRPFIEIWRDSPVLDDLRRREERLTGQCGDCRYNAICGGCRGRAWALTGDYLAADPSCFIPSKEETGFSSPAAA